MLRKPLLRAVKSGGLCDDFPYDEELQANATCENSEGHVLFAPTDTAKPHIQKKKKLSKRVRLHHDNVDPHTSDQIAHFGWTFFGHSPSTLNMSAEPFEA